MWAAGEDALRGGELRSAEMLRSSLDKSAHHCDVAPASAQFASRVIDHLALKDDDDPHIPHDHNPHDPHAQTNPPFALEVAAKPMEVHVNRFNIFKGRWKKLKQIPTTGKPEIWNGLKDNAISTMIKCKRKNTVLKLKVLCVKVNNPYTRNKELDHDVLKPNNTLMNYSLHSLRKVVGRAPDMILLSPL